jgi:hypothetical protein
MVVVVILAALAATPQGRAWAQEMVQFFRKVNFTSIPVSSQEQEWMNTPTKMIDLPLVPLFLPTSTPDMLSLQECQPPQDIQSYACQIAFTESKLGFNLKEFPKTLDGWIFKSVTFDAALQSATIIYSHYTEHGSEFIFKQGFGQFPNSYGNWSLVPAEKVETVQIGSYQGEYVLGSFSLRDGDNAWRWDTEGDIQRLAWNDGNRWYYIEILPPSPRYITRDELVKLADSLVDSPTVLADPLNPDSLTSIANAEKVSKLNLKAPTLLPLGYDFSYARYFPTNHEVHLHYGDSINKLTIYEWKGKNYDFAALAKIYSEHDITMVNGQPAFYGVPKAVAQYTSTYLLLAWRDEDLNYQMYFYFEPAWGGGLLDKDKMVAIAESMSDINDYKRNNTKPYEYVNIYETSLDFSIKKFSKEPKGWSFTNVSANVQPNCIWMTYTSKNESGNLYLNQCQSNTSPYLDQSNIPSNAIENVEIGKEKAQYIVGGFETDDNGKSVWNAGLLYRRLTWLEDGQWTEIIIYGESALLHNKDDLIALAESLQ